MRYIGPVIAARTQRCGDNALGLLTSTYFLAFGAAQLPLGMLLDRFGPRRVEAALLIASPPPAPRCLRYWPIRPQRPDDWAGR
jgi:MFS family permease